MRHLELYSSVDDGHAMLCELLGHVSDRAMASVKIDIDYSKKHAPLLINGHRVHSGDIAKFNNEKLEIYHV